MFKNVGITEDRVLKVNPDISLEDAAVEYEQGLKALATKNIPIKIAILGMGTDGHTCSIFSLVDASIHDKLAFPVEATGGFNRVSVSTTVLETVEKIILFVTGEKKKDILQEFRDKPLSLPSGFALQNHPNVEVWTDIPESEFS